MIEEGLVVSPEWVMKRAIDKNLRDKWTDGYEIMEYNDPPRRLNVIHIYCVFQRQTQKDGSLKQKGQIFLHGHQNS